MSKTTYKEFWNDHSVGTLWFASVARPAGETWIENTADTADLENYFDFSEIDHENWEDLEGTVELTEEGAPVWVWDGHDDPSCPSGSTLLNLKLYHRA